MDRLEEKVIDVPNTDTYNVINAFTVQTGDLSKINKPIKTTNIAQLNKFERRSRIKAFWLIGQIIITILLYGLVLTYDTIDKNHFVILAATIYTVISIIVSVKDFCVTYIKESKNLYETQLSFPVKNKLGNYILNKLLFMCGEINELTDESFKNPIFMRIKDTGEPFDLQTTPILNVGTQYVVHRDCVL